MDASFCVEALDDALGWRAPEILNTDQGAQFTSEAFADRVLAAGVTFSMDGQGPLPRQHLHRAAVAVAEVRGGVPLRAPGRARRRTHHWFLDRLLQRGAPALVPSRTDAGRSLSRRRGGVVRTIRRDAIHEAQPAQRRLRAWRDRRAPVPSVFPSAASPDGKTEVMFKPRLGGERPDRPARDPGGPRSDALGPGSSEITEGFGDHRNPP